MRTQRNTFSPDELVKIADMLGMEIAFIDKDAEVQNGEKYIIQWKEKRDWFLNPSWCIIYLESKSEVKIPICPQYKAKKK